MDDLLSTIQSVGQPQQAASSTPSQAPQQASSGFDPTKSYGTPSRLLDNLVQVESTNGKSLVNPVTGAIGPYQFLPSTVKMLKGQGVNFDPMDMQQSRAAADYYIQQLKQQNGGTYQGALKAYGGFKNTPPTAYINKVMAGVPTTPGQSNSGDTAQGYSGPMSDLLDTLQNAGTAKPAAPAPAPAAAPAQTPAAPTNTAGPIRQFGQAATALGDTLLGAPAAAISQGEYAVRRAFGQSPQAAQQGAEHGIGSFFSQPVSKAVNGVGALLGDNTDIRNTAGYQNEASQRAMGAVSQGINTASQAVSNATGLPQQDVANMAQTASLAVPGIVKGLAKVGGEAAVSTALDDANVKPAPAARPVGPAMQERTMAGGGAASSQSNPYPVFTGEEASRGQFPQVKTTKIVQDVTPEEQAVRAGIVNEIMGDNAGQARTGVITGNENLLRDEHAAAKSPQETPANQAMKAQFAQEQNALSNYAEQRVKATGADETLTNDTQRGNVINDAIYAPEGLNDFFKQAKQQIYDQARATSGDNPINTSHVDDLVSRPAFQASADISGNSGLVSGMAKRIELARTVGFEDPITGQMTQPGSVAAWDAVRKANNQNWSPQNARLIAGVNRAIDQDIASAAGSEAYKLGDAIHQTQQTLMGSDGFKKIFGDAEDNGIKNGTAAEKIPQALNDLRLDQWRHIYDTLDNLSQGRIAGAPEGMPAVPSELQQMAAAARNEMSGSLAREVYKQGADKAGVWNQNSVNKTLNSVVGQKILDTFPPDEVAKFHTLNYGGQIMPGVHSYEGAAQQAARLNKPGFVEKYAPHAIRGAAGALGSAVAGPVGGFVGALGGESVGTGISKLAGGARGAKQLRAVTEEMQANSRKGLDRLR